MSGRKRGGPRSPKAPAARKQDELLDRIEDRLRDAADGFHGWNSPAGDDAFAGHELSDENAAVWRRWNGLELAAGEARLLSLAEIEPLTAEASAAGILREGDRVIAERGRDVYVLPADPWAEGASVVRVEESGERTPDASSVAHMLLGWFGEIAVLYDDKGEFRDELFGEDGELVPAIARKLARRRLDLDEDAPGPRLELATSLRKAGEHTAARAELKQVLRRAPEWAWAHHELGRAHMGEGDRAAAAKSHREAAQHAGDDTLAAYFFAWAALASEGDARADLAQKVLRVRPDFAMQEAAAAQSLHERERDDEAREHVALGLAVVPSHLELLRLRGEIGTG